MKKLMVLGASYSQIPLIRAAKRLGYFVIACSIPGNYPGLAEADACAFADITDPEAVLRAAKEHGIDGITTCCMDLGTLAMGAVCEKMGLPGPSLSAAAASCDKAKEKTRYEEYGVPTAPFRIVRDREEIPDVLGQLHLPVMVKAVDLMGSRGIIRADSEEEVFSAYDAAMAATGKDFLIIEEFIDGTMFGVEALADEDELAYCLVLGNDMKGGNPSFPTGHFVPYLPGEGEGDKAGGASGAETARNIRSVTERVAKALGFRHCAMDLDCMYKDGKIYVIEATCRAGATCITDTVSIYYGLDYFEAIARAAMGENVKHLFEREDTPHTPSVTKLLASPKEGVLHSFAVPDALPDAVADLSFNKKKGDALRPMQNGADRIGQLIVRGSSVRECRDLMAQVMAKTSIIYEDGSEETVC